VVACCGFGVVGLTWGPAAARRVVDGILGRPGPPIPAALSARRLG
jgi:glycine/D-amino acid oxidase-like deaminating enzyme